MATFANQRTVSIHRSVIDKTSRKPFLMAHTDCIYEASRELDGTSFKVYIYLLSNKDGYTFDFSPTHAANILGISRDSAREAFDKLERKHFIVSRSYGHYDFYEYQNHTEAERAAAARAKRHAAARNYTHHLDDVYFSY